MDVISLPELLSIFGLILTGATVFGSVLWNLWRKVMKNTEELAAFKLNVAEKYISGNRLADFEQKMMLSEERLHGVLENLTSRIDRMLERMEK